MKKYIDKSALVAELNRLIAELIEEGEDTIFEQGRISAFEDIKAFINHTLEVKEINNVWNNANDFLKAEAGRSILLIEDNGHAELLKSPSAERLFYFRSANLKMWAYVDELLSITTHFDVKEVDLEKDEPVSKDLEEAACEYADGENPTCPCEECLIKTFKAGAIWQKDHTCFAGRTKTIEEIKEALLSEVLPCFMHGGEADEVVAKLDEVLNKK